MRTHGIIEARELSIFEKIAQKRKENEEFKKHLENGWKKIVKVLKDLETKYTNISFVFEDFEIGFGENPEYPGNYIYFTPKGFYRMERGKNEDVPFKDYYPVINWIVGFIENNTTH